MDAREYKNIFENEESHFFYVSNHKIILSLIQQYSDKAKNLKILDAGCGTGLLARKLKKFGEVIGIDISEEALGFAKRRGVKAIKGTVSKIPFKSKSFDLVTCIDVINHRWVKSDSKAMRELHRVLKPGGILIIRASANPWLHLMHDDHVLLKERYDKKTFAIKLKKAGFKIEKASCTNSILLPIAIIKMIIERLSRFQKVQSGISSVPRYLNTLFTILLSWEAWFLRFFNLPFGIALVAVCKKEA